MQIKRKIKRFLLIAQALMIFSLSFAGWTSAFVGKAQAISPVETAFNALAANPGQMATFNIANMTWIPPSIQLPIPYGFIVGCNSCAGATFDTNGNITNAPTLPSIPTAYIARIPANWNGKNVIMIPPGFVNQTFAAPPIQALLNGIKNIILGSGYAFITMNHYTPGKTTDPTTAPPGPAPFDYNTYFPGYQTVDLKNEYSATATLLKNLVTTAFTTPLATANPPPTYGLGWSRGANLGMGLLADDPATAFDGFVMIGVGNGRLSTITSVIKSITTGGGLIPLTKLTIITTGLPPLVLQFIAAELIGIADSAYRTIVLTTFSAFFAYDVSTRSAGVQQAWGDLALASNLQRKTIIIQGLHDRTIFPSDTFVLANAIISAGQSSNMRLYLMKNLGHSPGDLPTPLPPMFIDAIAKLDSWVQTASEPGAINQAPLGAPQPSCSTLGFNDPLQCFCNVMGNVDFNAVWIPECAGSRRRIIENMLLTQNFTTTTGSDTPLSLGVDEAQSSQIASLTFTSTDQPPVEILESAPAGATAFIWNLFSGLEQFLMATLFDIHDQTVAFTGPGGTSYFIPPTAGDYHFSVTASFSAGGADVTGTFTVTAIGEAPAPAGAAPEAPHGAAPTSLDVVDGLIASEVTLSDPLSDAKVSIPGNTTVVNSNGSNYTGSIMVPSVLSESQLPKALPTNLKFSNAIVIGTDGHIFFDQDITITIPLPAEVDPTLVKIYFYNETTGAYQMVDLGGTISADGKTISVTTNHLTIFVAAEKISGVETRLPFRDVTGHWAYSSIKQLFDIGVVIGRTPTTFAPDEPLKRSEIVKVALLAFAYPVSDVVDSNPFKDVDKDEWYAKYVAAAQADGIIQGYADGTFRPGMAINRAEALKILMAAAKRTAKTESVAPFTDVQASAWYAPLVNFAFQKGIVNGKTPTTFVPNGKVTRGEMAKMIVQLLLL